MLGGRGQFTQVVRLDQTQVLAFLNGQSGYAFEISGDLTSNEVVHRLGGYPVQFVKNFYRQATPPNPQNIQSFSDAVANGRADQKITALSMLQMFVAEYRSVKNPPVAVLQQAAQMMEAIHLARRDPLPAVAAWACKCEAELVSPGAFENVVRDMAEDPDWRHRQLALMLVANLQPSARDELVAKLKLDPQESVQSDANAVQGMLALPAPTTLPTTMSTTMPATSPTTVPDVAPVGP